MVFSAFEATRQTLYEATWDEVRGTVVSASELTVAAAGSLPPVAESGQGSVADYLADARTGLPPPETPPAGPYHARLGLDFVGAPGVGVSTSPSSRRP